MNMRGVYRRSMVAAVVVLLAVASCSAQGDDSADTAPVTTAQPPLTSAAAPSTSDDDGVLERNCVVAAGKQVTSWTGGGLHAETNPAERTPARCTAIVQVVGDAWQREFPEFGSADDDGNGFHCGDPGIADVSLDYGDTSAGLDPTRGS